MLIVVFCCCSICCLSLAFYLTSKFLVVLNWCSKLLAHVFGIVSWGFVCRLRSCVVYVGITVFYLGFVYVLKNTNMVLCRVYLVLGVYYCVVCLC